MSCKLIRPDDQAAAQAIPWRPGGSAAVSHGQQASQPSAPPSADVEREMMARAQAAYQQGLAAGETAGAQRASQRIDPAIASLNAIIQEIAGLRKKVRMEAEESAVKLSIAIARRVIHRELATDPEAILGLVMAAFQKVNARETHKLRISPADLAVIQENRARLEIPVGLEISADASMPAGSAVFETSRGELDASVDTQLGEIERGFADIVRRRSR